MGEHGGYIDFIRLELKLEASQFQNLLYHAQVTDLQHWRPFQVVFVMTFIVAISIRSMWSLNVFINK